MKYIQLFQVSWQIKGTTSENLYSPDLYILNMLITNGCMSLSDLSVNKVSYTCNIPDVKTGHSRPNTFLVQV